jgi:hypothetical protein
MDLEIKRRIAEVPDLRHRVRQLRWFKTSFRQHARLIAQHYGLAVTVDETRLTGAFLNWAERFATDRDYARLDRRDFVTFMAGLLLRELLTQHPVEATTASSGQLPTLQNDRDATIVRTWPEGFIATNYCLCVLAAVLEQEGMDLTLSDVANDLRTWWSYRENIGEDPDRAIAFLDLFAGAEPNWYMPDSVSGRAAIKRALDAKVVPAVEQEPAAARL